MRHESERVATSAIERVSGIIRDPSISIILLSCDVLKPLVLHSAVLIVQSGYQSLMIHMYTELVNRNTGVEILLLPTGR